MQTQKMKKVKNNLDDLPRNNHPSSSTDKSSSSTNQTQPLTRGEVFVAFDSRKNAQDGKNLFILNRLSSKRKKLTKNRKK